jgi:hypothetical protein
VPPVPPLGVADPPAPATPPVPPPVPPDLLPPEAFSPPLPVFPPPETVPPDAVLPPLALPPLPLPPESVLPPDCEGEPLPPAQARKGRKRRESAKALAAMRPLPCQRRGPRRASGVTRFFSLFILWKPRHCVVRKFCQSTTTWDRATNRLNEINTRTRMFGKGHR